jgi:hypothetical protein
VLARAAGFEPAVPFGARLTAVWIYQFSYARMIWWSTPESNRPGSDLARIARGPSACPELVDRVGSAPTTAACGTGAHLNELTAQMVLGVGFEPTSPALQAGAFTRSAFRAIWCGRWGSSSHLSVGNAPRHVPHPLSKRRQVALVVHPPIGRDDRTRTCILRLRRAALIQLSYVTVRARRRPHGTRPPPGQRSSSTSQ